SATSRGKSSGPPGAGSPHTSSSRKSRVSSWMRQGREVCAASGSLIGNSIHTELYLLISLLGCSSPHCPPINNARLHADSAKQEVKVVVAGYMVFSRKGHSDGKANVGAKQSTDRATPANCSLIFRANSKT